MGSWKQPVLMAFDTAVTSTLLLQLVAALEDLGYPVRAVVSDMGPKNIGLWKALQIRHDGLTGIPNPHQKDR